MRNRSNYPKGWRQMARACKERAGWRCERCGIPHGTLRLSSWTGRLWPVYLQAAHLHHDPHNTTPTLVACCPHCHWKHYRRPGQRPAWIIEQIKHRKLLAQAYCL